MYQRSSVSQVKSQNRSAWMLSLGEKVCPTHLCYADDFGMLPADAVNDVAG